MFHLDLEQVQSESRGQHGADAYSRRLAGAVRNQAGTRPVLDVDDVGTLALTDDLVHGSWFDELDVDLFGERTTSSWLVD